MSLVELNAVKSGGVQLEMKSYKENVSMQQLIPKNSSKTSKLHLKASNTISRVKIQLRMQSYRSFMFFLALQTTIWKRNNVKCLRPCQAQNTNMAVCLNNNSSLTEKEKRLIKILYTKSNYNAFLLAKLMLEYFIRA